MHLGRAARGPPRALPRCLRRHDPELRAVRDRLRAAGKPYKVVLIALARKLLTRLNAMVRDGTDYRGAAA